MSCKKGMTYKRSKVALRRIAVAIPLAVLLTQTQIGKAEVDVRRDAIVEAVNKVLPTVVNISAATLVEIHDPFEEFFSQFFDPYHRGRPQTQYSYSLGSGVIIDEEGYILTNNHVVQRGVEDPEHSKIGVKIGTNEYSATIEGASPLSDIALLKIQLKPGEKLNLKAVQFAKDDDLLLGETVIALGNPFGLGNSVSRGILSSTTRRPNPEKGALDYEDWLQTDAAVNPGNSGGPLVNLKGELIGINNAVYRQNDAQGISFAIPIKRVGEALSEIFSPENKGYWFGARIKSTASQLSVTSIQPGSPAEKAGLRVGDVVAKIADKAPKNFIEFMVELIKRSDRGDVPLMVSRKGSLQTVSVKVIPQKKFFTSDLIRQRIGATLQEINADTAAAMGVNPGSGLVVMGVDRNSPAATAGLQPGFIVTGIDGEAINDVTEAAKIFYEKKKDERVSLNIVAVQRQGRFVSFNRGRAEIRVR